jgi:hypothetical protein
MSRQLKFNAVPELVEQVAILPKSANSEVRFQVNRRYGKRYVSISLWFRKRGGEWWRRTAMHFAPDELDQALVALHKARTSLRIAQDVPEPPTPDVGVGE